MRLLVQHDDPICIHETSVMTMYSIRKSKPLQTPNPWIFWPVEGPRNLQSLEGGPRRPEFQASSEPEPSEIGAPQQVVDDRKQKAEGLLSA
jgi:hypothetical protein